MENWICMWFCYFLVHCECKLHSLEYSNLKSWPYEITASLTTFAIGSQVEISSKPIV